MFIYKFLKVMFFIFILVSLLNLRKYVKLRSSIVIVFILYKLWFFFLFSNKFMIFFKMLEEIGFFFFKGFDNICFIFFINF